MAEWSKALRLGRNIFGCVGSNPTPCTSYFDFFQSRFFSFVFKLIFGTSVCMCTTKCASESPTKQKSQSKRDIFLDLYLKNKTCFLLDSD